MPTIPNTIADSRRWLSLAIDEMDHLRCHPDPDESVFGLCAQIARQAGDLLARRGLAAFYEKSRSFRDYATPDSTKAFLSECVAAVDSLPRLPGPPPPYLNSEQAADYLNMTRGQLYRQVEIRKLEPLRGAGNSYLFTIEMLDSYAQNC